MQAFSIELQPTLQEQLFNFAVSMHTTHQKPSSIMLYQRELTVLSVEKA